MQLEPQQRWCRWTMEYLSSNIRIFRGGSAKPRSWHFCPISQLQSIWTLATICHLGRLRTFRSWVEQYSRNCVDLDHVLSMPDHDFGLKDSMPYWRIDEVAFSYDGRYVTGLWDCTEQSMGDGHYEGQSQWPLERLNSYRRSHGMRLLWAHFETWWERMAGTNLITATEWSPAEMDCLKIW